MRFAPHRIYNRIILTGQVGAAGTGNEEPAKGTSKPAKGTSRVSSTPVVPFARSATFFPPQEHPHVSHALALVSAAGAHSGQRLRISAGADVTSTEANVF